MLDNMVRYGETLGLCGLAWNGGTKLTAVLRARAELCRRSESFCILGAYGRAQPAATFLIVEPVRALIVA